MDKLFNRPPSLIVMLTYNDYTVENAEEIFETSKDSLAQYWGMKEKPLSIERMKNLFSRMKECGKTTVLEVVGYEKEDALEGAKIAAECRCDILMGTTFFESVAKFCKSHGISYFPFIGKAIGRPSVLTGTIEEMVDEANHTIKNGANGVDLLGYRFEGDALLLIKTVVNSICSPVIVAGSIDSYHRLDEIFKISPAAFTIGSAFFDNKFEGSFSQQIDKVCKYLIKKHNDSKSLS